MLITGKASEIRATKALLDSPWVMESSSLSRCLSNSWESDRSGLVSVSGRVKGNEKKREIN